MPNYPFKCDCGFIKDKHYPLSESSNSPYCEVCNKKMYKDFSRISVYVDQTLGYYDHQLDAYIGSASDRRRIAKEKGFIPVTPDEARTFKPAQQKTEAETREEYKTIFKDAAYEVDAVKAS